MNIANLINKNPQMLTISPTHKCTSSCENCCFACNPEIGHIMEKNQIIKYIDEALQEYPTIKVLVITGGECFVLGDDLEDIIRHASKYKIIIRVVTNAFWAKTYDIAYKRLKKLVDVGLNEINFSTGDNHLKYVGIENIENAVLASNALGLMSICISLEAHNNSHYKLIDLHNNSRIKHLISAGNVITLNASWMKFKKDLLNKDIKEPNYILNDTKRPCKNLFNGITINPYNQMLACCGLTVEYNKFLKLGSLEKYSIKDLYEKQFEDLFKFWLFVDGPEFIYEKVMKLRNISKQIFPHECAYCIELTRDQENINYIKELLIKELPEIIYRNQFN